MKNIGIASVYSKINYGTVLQAYATQKILDELGYSNFTMDMRGINNEINKKKKKYFLTHIYQKDMISSKVGLAIKKVLVKINHKGLKRKETIRKNEFI
jgi:hypothetical protein